jgi:hypothetical protein
MHQSVLLTRQVKRGSQSFPDFFVRFVTFVV